MMMNSPKLLRARRGPIAVVSFVCVLVGGCQVENRDSKQIKFVPAIRTKEFLKHWTKGNRSAWFNPSTNEVVIVDENSGHASRIVGLPSDLGWVIAVGWEKTGLFFVHYSKAFDTGTMVYIDLGERKVVRIEPWGAW